MKVDYRRLCGLGCADGQRTTNHHEPEEEGDRMKIDYRRLSARTPDNETASFAETVMEDHGSVSHDAAMKALGYMSEASWSWGCFPDHLPQHEVVEHELDYIIAKLTQFRDGFHDYHKQAFYERQAHVLLREGKYEQLAVVAGVLTGLSKRLDPETYELFKTCIIKED